MKTAFILAVSVAWMVSEAEAWRSAEAVSIAVAGEWHLNIGQSEMVAGKSNFKSASDQIRLRITGSKGRWKVYVRKRDTNWHSNFVLKMRKISGQSKPVITVEDTDREFFSGERDGNFDLEIVLEGVSVAVPPDTYSTTVIYTVTEE